jgi:hypothetical protein
VLHDQNRPQNLIGQTVGDDPIVRKRGQLQTDESAAGLDGAHVAEEVPHGTRLIAFGRFAAESYLRRPTRQIADSAFVS